MGRNYSVTTSAADSLGVVKDSLKAALDGLVAIVSGIAEAGTRPAGFSLSQNYPNPFNPATVLQLTIADRQMAIVSVYDALGREVARLVDEMKEPGTYIVQWDAKGMASGVYYTRMTAGQFTQTRMMLLVR
jgi:hypothetical protein